MKKSFLIFAVAMMLVLSLTACSQTIELENNEVLVQYMSRILSTANEIYGWHDFPETELPTEFGFTTGTAVIITDTDAKVEIEFEDAFTTESDAVEAHIIVTKPGTKDAILSFEIAFTHEGVEYQAEGTAVLYELKDISVCLFGDDGPCWVTFDSLKIGKKTYKDVSMLVYVDGDFPV